MAQVGGVLFVGKEKGQILLVVVLATIVALTVGLSVASRTITNLKISKQNEESQRAFQAAEAGVEEAIKQVGNQTTLSNSLSNNSSFNTTITQEKSNSFLLNNGNPVDQDVGQEVWLSNYPDYTSPMTTPITIRWGTSEQSCTGSGNGAMPALEIVVLSGSKSSPVLTKHIFDTCGRISGTDSFTSVAGTIEGTTFNYSADISEANKLLVKIIPLYTSAKIGVEGQNMPPQGNVIESVGTSGDTKRKIIYFESYPQIPPEVMPYSIITQ